MVKLRVVLGVVSVALVTGCNEGGPRSVASPTPITVTPPVVSAPAPTPQPSVTNYAGRWIGSYVVEQCAGSSGSMDDVLCSSPRPGNAGGIFQRGVALPIAIELTQSGNSLDGVLSLGGYRGPISGSVRSNQSILLSGVATGNSGSVVVTNTISSWDTFQAGSLMEGTIAFAIKVSIFPGDGVIRARLSNVRR